MSRPRLIEQAASDFSTDFHIWRFKSRQVLDTHEMPAQKEWLDLLKSLEKLDAVLNEIEEATYRPHTFIATCGLCHVEIGGDGDVCNRCASGTMPAATRRPVGRAK